jgi:hypothetical protein
MSGWDRSTASGLGRARIRTPATVPPVVSCTQPGRYLLDAGVFRPGRVLSGRGRFVSADGETTVGYFAQGMLLGFDQSADGLPIPGAWIAVAMTECYVQWWPERGPWSNRSTPLPDFGLADTTVAAMLKGRHDDAARLTRIRFAPCEARLRAHLALMYRTFCPSGAVSPMWERVASTSDLAEVLRCSPGLLTHELLDVRRAAEAHLAARWIARAGFCGPQLPE